MEEYLTIFDDIYYIKDDIPDEVYLSLNNKVMKLLQELKECKNKLNDIDERSYSSGSAIDDEYDEEYYDENEELSNIDSSENSDEEVEVIEIPICNCVEKNSYPDFLNFADVKILECFCLDSDEAMKSCENFVKLIDDFPLLNNLFEKQDLSFIEEPINAEYNLDRVTRTTRLFLALISRFRIYPKRGILKLVMYDYLLRNSRFLIENQKFAKTVLRIYEDFLEKESNFIPLAIEYNINYARWRDFFKGFILEE